MAVPVKKDFYVTLIMGYPASGELQATRMFVYTDDENQTIYSGKRHCGHRQIGVPADNRDARVARQPGGANREGLGTSTICRWSEGTGDTGSRRTLRRHPSQLSGSRRPLASCTSETGRFNPTHWSSSKQTSTECSKNSACRRR